MILDFDDYHEIIKCYGWKGFNSHSMKNVFHPTSDRCSFRLCLTSSTEGNPSTSWGTAWMGNTVSWSKLPCFESDLIFINSIDYNPVCTDIRELKHKGSTCQSFKFLTWQITLILFPGRTYSFILTVRQLNILAMFPGCYLNWWGLYFKCSTQHWNNPSPVQCISFQLFRKNYLIYQHCGNNVNHVVVLLVHVWAQDTDKHITQC